MARRAAMKPEKNENVLALDAHLGVELHRRSTELTRAWLDRLIARLDVQPRRIFPTDALLNHIPDVLRAVSDFLCSDGELDHDELLRSAIRKSGPAGRGGGGGR